MMNKLQEIEDRAAAIPQYPYKKWPMAFVQYPEVNQLLDYGLSAQEDIPYLIKELRLHQECVRELESLYAIIYESMDFPPGEDCTDDICS